MKVKVVLLSAAVLAAVSGTSFAQNSAAPNTGTTMSQPPKNTNPLPAAATKQKDASPASQNAGSSQEK